MSALIDEHDPAAHGERAGYITPDPGRVRQTRQADGVGWPLAARQDSELVAAHVETPCLPGGVERHRKPPPFGRSLRIALTVCRCQFSTTLEVVLLEGAAPSAPHAQPEAPRRGA